MPSRGLRGGMVGLLFDENIPAFWRKNNSTAKWRIFWLLSKNFLLFSQMPKMQYPKNEPYTLPNAENMFYYTPKFGAHTPPYYPASRSQRCVKGPWKGWCTQKPSTRDDKKICKYLVMSPEGPKTTPPPVDPSMKYCSKISIFTWKYHFFTLLWNLSVLMFVRGPCSSLYPPLTKIWEPLFPSLRQTLTLRRQRGPYMSMEWERIHITTQAFDFPKLFLQKEKNVLTCGLDIWRK